uniref:Uncharacterized protein n=1 Tax=Aegilops tauschii TaxID=37682 RepID=R7W107_AEGTA
MGATRTLERVGMKATRGGGKDSGIRMNVVLNAWLYAKSQVNAGECGIKAPNLEILGSFLVVVSKLLLFKGISSVSSTNSMHTVKVFALRSSGDKLDAVLNILKWFPCLEKLYVTFHLRRDKRNEPLYDPLHPIECLETRLKKVVFKSFLGIGNQLEFARFFVLNAKVLDRIEFEVYNGYSRGKAAYLRMLLQVKNRASRDARFEFRISPTEYGLIDMC